MASSHCAGNLGHIYMNHRHLQTTLNGSEPEKQRTIRVGPASIQAVPILAQLILRKLTVQRLYLVSESPGPDKTNLLMIRFHDSTRYPCSYYV